MPALPELAIGRVSLARVARHEAWLASGLDAADRERLRTLHVPKRRIDFIGGRVAARRALDRLGLAGPIELDTGARSGAPTVNGGALSITHGAGWACAAATRGTPIGIDIERIEPRHPALHDEAFAPGELDGWARFAGDTGDALVTLAWCAKEAWLKVRGEGLRAVLPEVALVPLRDLFIDERGLRVVEARAGGETLLLGLERRGDARLALAVPT